MKLQHVLTAILLVFCAVAEAQQACQPPAVAKSDRPNIFTEEQEKELGDIQAEHFAASLKLIEEEELTGTLNRIGERLVRALPPTKLRIQFYLLDAPVSNALTIAGGRVYVTRKLIATTRNEDELAGVLAHELGHVVTRQIPQEYTRLWREVLGVSSVGDRADIEDKYHQFVESYREKPDAFRDSEKHEEKEQMAADQVGIYAVMRAGYSPQSFFDFLDRLTETKGKTGSWLSDLFGTTKPEGKRLREIAKTIAVLPVNCIDPSQHATPEGYQKWRTAVVTYTGTGRKESVHNVALRRELNPWLEGEVAQVKFSPNGKYVLAQDGASVFVLTRDPFKTLFRIDAPDAAAAQFTPDSQSVVFTNSALRVEKWSISERQIQEAHELHIRRGCMQNQLSPDGAVLACLQPPENNGPSLDMVLYDVESGSPAFAKKGFYTPFYSQWLRYYVAVALGNVPPPFMNMAFTPDAHYALMGRGMSHLGVDLSTKTEMHLPGSVKKLTELTYTFLGNDRLVGLNAGHPEKSAVVRFPSGETLVEGLPLGYQWLEGATHGDTVLLRPIKNYAVGAMNINSRKIFAGNKTSAFDLYDSECVGEIAEGGLALYPKLEDANYIGHVLPRAPLGRLRAAVISPDSRFLAISDRDRGAMWDLQTGERLFHVRAFRGGWFDNAGTLHTIYPPVPAKYRASPAGGDDEGAGDSKKKEDKPKKPENLTGLWTMDPKTRTDHLVRSFDSSERVNQVGPYILVVKTEGKNNFWGAAQPETLEFQDVNSEKLLWSRRFAKGAPDAFVHPQSATVVLVWSLAQEGARELVSHDAALEQQVENIPHANTGYLVEVLEAQSGKRKAMFPVDTRSRSFRVESARAVGDRIFVSDNTGRVLVYSLTGEQKGRVFGRHLVASSEGKSLAVEPSPGHVVVYDAETLRRRDEFTFTTSAARIWFTDDGKRLAVLTADQVFYILEPAKVPAASASIH